MFYHPDLIVYLWLLPVTILIILPLLLKGGCLLYQQTSWGKAALNPDALPNHIVPSTERRKHPRIAVQGAYAMVSGRCECCEAVVENISKFGICVKNLPQELMNEAKKFKVIVKTQAGNFEMFVNPRWNKQREAGHRVGAQLEIAH